MPLCLCLESLCLITGATLIAANSDDSAFTVNRTFHVEQFLSSNNTEHDTTVNFHREKKTLADDNNSVSNSDELFPRIDLPPEGWTSAIITEIMESWPLQVRFSTDNGDFIVELAIEAVIESETGMLSPGDISPGDQVDILIESNSSQPSAYHIVHIKRR